MENFILNIAGTAFNFAVQNATRTAIDGISLFALWQIIGILWEKLKPIQHPLQFAKEKSYSSGLKLTLFLEKRIPDEKFRDARIKEVADGSEDVQDAFVRGLYKQPFNS